MDKWNDRNVIRMKEKETKNKGNKQQLIVTNIVDSKPTVSIIALNWNVPNTSRKRQIVRMYKKQEPSVLICCIKETQFKYKDTE